MIYFDTDVLVNAYFVQDQSKNLQALEAMDLAKLDSAATISTLSVQETLFALGRLAIGAREMSNAFEHLMQLQPVVYGIPELRRAYELATNVGFRNINDCIHTAIAESHCTELVTYNRQDFSRIRDFARVGITIL